MARSKLSAHWLVWAAGVLGVVGCAPASGKAPARAPVASVPAPPPAAPSEASLEDAQRAFDESRYADAEAAFRRHLEGPGAVQARAGLARVLMFTGRRPEAAALLEAGLAAAPRDLELTTLLAENVWAGGGVERALELLAGVSGDPAARRARLLTGEVLLDVGRRADAERALMTLIEDYNEDRIGPEDGPGLAMVGRAAYLLRSPHDANDAFNAAERAAPGDARTLLWRAELFLDKHDPGHAEEVVGEVLEQAPNHPRALVWMAHVKLEQALDFAAARELCERALAIDPGLTHAFFVLAGLALRDLEFEAALELVARGLKQDPQNLELLSMRAAVGFLSEDKALFGAARDAVFAKNRSYSRFYSIVGEFAEWEHRYERIVDMMREAVAVDDEDARAHAALGLNLIRAGQELAGVQSLRRAAAKDPFNVRVYNTLNLYEQIIPEGYVSRARGRFLIRYPKGEAELLDRYVPALLERAFTELERAYQFTPSEPIGIELYELREHFAVRTSGLPQTAILGVCFGKTLASLTPKSEPFNLGVTLWHELAHVFHIQMSDSRVPRWLTEGLAEYETLVERPEWRRFQDADLYRARRLGRLPPLGSLNRAFSHAEHMQDMATAYYASSQVAVMLMETFGRARLNEVLRLHGQGRDTRRSLEAALGRDVAALEGDFQRFLDKSLARYARQFVPLEVRGELEELEELAAERPADVTAQLGVVLGALRQRDLERARAMWARAAALEPSSADVRFLGARLAAAEGDEARARRELEQLAAAGHDGYALQMALAELSDPKAAPAALAAALRRAHQHDPSEAAPLQGLLSLAVEAGDSAEELRLLELLAPLSAHDPTVHRRLLQLLVEQKDHSRAVAAGEAAIYADMEGTSTHMYYARALAGVGRLADAEFEFRSAVLTPGRPEELAEAHSAFADFLDARGQSERAAVERARARELQPPSAAPSP